MNTMAHFTNYSDKLNVVSEIMNLHFKFHFKLPTFASISLNPINTEKVLLNLYLIYSFQKNPTLFILSHTNSFRVPVS